MREGSMEHVGGLRAPGVGSVLRGGLAGLIALVAAAVASPESFAQG